MKKIVLVSILIFVLNTIYSQQWSGSTTNSGLIYRSGNIITSDLTIGKYGSALCGDAAPYQISTPINNGTHDLLVYGVGTSSMLNLRLYDGSLKFGSSSSPNAEIYNNGSGFLVET
jgi:hypothetical protein